MSQNYSAAVAHSHYNLLNGYVNAEQFSSRVVKFDMSQQQLTRCSSKKLILNITAR